MAAVGEPRQNGDAERVIRTITEEEIDLAEDRDCAEALTQIGPFIDDVYRTKRMHSALGYLRGGMATGTRQSTRPLKS